MAHDDIARFLEELPRSYQGFELLNPRGGDRHGAHEWVWLGRDAERYLYVSLAVTGDSPGRRTVELWAGADDRRHFGRVLVHQTSGPWRPEEFTSLFKAAAERARSFSRDEMTRTYVVQQEEPPSQLR